MKTSRTNGKNLCSLTDFVDINMRNMYTNTSPNYKNFEDSIIIEVFFNHCNYSSCTPLILEDAITTVTHFIVTACSRYARIGKSLLPKKKAIYFLAPLWTLLSSIAVFLFYFTSYISSCFLALAKIWVRVKFGSDNVKIRTRNWCPTPGFFRVGQFAWG